MDEEDNKKKGKKFPSRIVSVPDNYRVVINMGERDGIIIGQRFVIYTLSENDIIDPVTKENLGKLENFKGTGKVIHVQYKMATIESDMAKSDTKNIFSRNPILPFLRDVREEELKKDIIMPFDSPDISDFVKPI